MFYNCSDCHLKLLGVFYVDRIGEENILVKDRQHIAIAYRIKGESRFVYEEKIISAPTGSISFVPPGVDFLRSNTPETLIVVHLHSIESMGDSIEIIESAEDMEPYFRKLLSAWTTQGEFRYNQSMEQLYALFYALHLKSGRDTSAIPASIRPGVSLMRENYTDPELRISDLSGACFISEVYFRKLYHEYFGESPQQTILAMRFRRAKELLSSGYYSQKETARLSGFSDVKYFRTAFKTCFGETPSDYMKKTHVSPKIQHDF